MTNLILAPFAFEYMQRAFLAALVVGTLCSTIGTYVVLRRLSFIGDGIAHASFAGIVIAYLRGLDYYVGAAIVAVLTALGIGYINRRGGVSLDTAIGVLFTGAILTETIFSWPGVGKWLIEAINRRDYPVLQGGTLLIGTVVMAVNLMVELTYGLINPRIRHAR